MKIFIITNNFFPVVGGISTYVDDLSKGLSNSNVDSVLFFPERENTFGMLQKVLFVFHSIYKIGISFKAQEEVIVHSHSANYCLAIGLICRLLYGHKVIHTYHTPIEKLNWSFFFTRFSDAIVYVSAASRELYHSYGVIEHAEEVLIPGGVDLSKFNNKNCYRHGNRKNILFVGRIDEEKGIKELIHAVSKVKCSFVLSIIGSAQTKKQEEYLADVIGLVSSLELNDHVKFFGSVQGERLNDIYKAADIFVLPSICNESAPMVIAEAFAAALPIISFRTDGIEERIRDQNN
jgi:prepilin-type processing-associated H-X9-DG protein